MYRGLPAYQTLVVKRRQARAHFDLTGVGQIQPLALGSAGALRESAYPRRGVALKDARFSSSAHRLATFANRSVQRFFANRNTR